MENVMLTRLQLKNFKRFEDVDIELGQTVVFIGPNNSGKSTALQALALWETGLRMWNEKRGGKEAPEKRPGVTINRRDLVAIPMPHARLIWHKLHVRDVKRVDGKPKTKNIRIEIIVSGITGQKEWECGLEFDYQGEETFICRPLSLGGGKTAPRMPIPEEAGNIHVAFLPPMSGLAANERRIDIGAVNVLIGEGRTAEVLRNLCYRIFEKNRQKLTENIYQLFGVKLAPPVYVAARGEVTMNYEDITGVELDLSCSGRGLQQTLLLLAYLYANPGAVLLLDEPDAHLEILRQRQIYELITQVANEQNGQIIAASHSEVLLNEAADRDIVIAFVGKPHRIDDRGSQVRKALMEIGFDQYYQAEQTGWVLYLEGSTDLAILRAFAKTLKHPAEKHLERPFVHYVLNEPQSARSHFRGLFEAKHDLVGIAIFDRIEKPLIKNQPLEELMWKNREIENYLCMPRVLFAYARQDQPNDLFGAAEANSRIEAMKKSIEEVGKALKTLGKGDPWSPDIKASDDFLDPLFRKYFEMLKLPNLLNKTDYHVLASLVHKDIISDEITEKLDAIVEVAEKSRPRED